MVFHFHFLSPVEEVAVKVVQAAQETLLLMLG